jgi:hypothetical protein
MKVRRGVVTFLPVAICLICLTLLTGCNHDPVPDPGGLTPGPWGEPLHLMARARAIPTVIR